MTVQNITFTVAAMAILGSFLWALKIALKPKKQPIALKINQDHKRS